MTDAGLRGSSDRSMLILTSLAGGSKHGYALIKDIEDISGVRLGPGSLYGCLTKLEGSGLVEALPSDDRRRPYRLTAQGKRVLRERLTESERIARLGLKRLAAT